MLEEDASPPPDQAEQEQIGWEAITPKPAPLRPKTGYKAREKAPEPEQLAMPTPADSQLLDVLTQLYDIPVNESQRANDVMAKAATQSWMEASWTQLEDYFYGKWTCFPRPQPKVKR
jgi:hypothetical protein